MNWFGCIKCIWEMEVVIVIVVWDREVIEKDCEDKSIYWYCCIFGNFG